VQSVWIASVVAVVAVQARRRSGKETQQTRGRHEQTTHEQLSTQPQNVTAL